MNRSVVAFFCFLLCCLFLTGRCFVYQNISKNGKQILVPVFVHAEKTNTFPYKVSLRYNNIIPASYIEKITGTIVVRRLHDGKIRFVRLNTHSLPLRPEEMLLRYRIRQIPGIHQNTEKSQINFATDKYPLYTEKNLEKFLKQARAIAVKYAVLKVDDKGKALLIGFTGQNRLEKSKR